jgi:hypothetical protein
VRRPGRTSLQVLVPDDQATDLTCGSLAVPWVVGLVPGTPHAPAFGRYGRRGRRQGRRPPRGDRIRLTILAHRATAVPALLPLPEDDGREEPYRQDQKKDHHARVRRTPRTAHTRPSGGNRAGQRRSGHAGGIGSPRPTAGSSPCGPRRVEILALDHRTRHRLSPRHACWCAWTTGPPANAAAHDRAQLPRLHLAPPLQTSHTPTPGPDGDGCTQQADTTFDPPNTRPSSDLPH